MPPIALCEVQGYVYAALDRPLRTSRPRRGDDDLRRRAPARAPRISKRRFNRDFWLEEQRLARDGPRPRQAAARRADVEHGPLPLDRHPRRGQGARSSPQRLVSDEMFSGWGIRTLASSMTGYNPISYHNGSVWPHDNAICAAGLMRYGFVDEAHRVMEGIVDAAAYFGNRLPELFAGLARDEFSFPVSYPTSCSPQAWAAASPLLFLRSMLHFDPDMRDAQLHLAPAVPEWIGRLALARRAAHGRAPLDRGRGRPVQRARAARRPHDPGSAAARDRLEGLKVDPQSATSEALTTFSGVSRTSSSPGTPLRSPYSSARSAPM